MKDQRCCCGRLAPGCAWYPCGLDAVEAAGEFQPDVVFVDIGLPGIDGAADVVKRTVAEAEALLSGGDRWVIGAETAQAVAG